MANYSSILKEASARYNIPMGVLERQMMAESGGNAQAKSPAGALGLMQLMPATARGLGVTNPLDPRQNIMGGAKYLRDQINHFGNLRSALAAYNAGPGAVTKYGGVPPFHETQAYVNEILGGSSLPNVGAAPQESPPALAASAGMGVRAPTRQQPNFMQMATQLASSAVPQLGGLGVDSSTSVGGGDSILGHLADLTAQEPGAMSWKQFVPQRQLQPKAPAVLPDIRSVQGLHSAVAGQTPMITGNVKAGEQLYPNLDFSSHTDWDHVNPRLLKAVDAAAKKFHAKATIISGYRSNKYSQSVGGFAGDPHTKGLAVDAYINGHPIGDVIPPQEWAKLGIRSGNTPGFFNGKPDPEHLDLVGLPEGKKR